MQRGRLALRVYAASDLANGSLDRPVARVVPLDGATDAEAKTSAALSAADHRVAEHFCAIHRATSQLRARLVTTTRVERAARRGNANLELRSSRCGAPRRTRRVGARFVRSRAPARARARAPANRGWEARRLGLGGRARASCARLVRTRSRCNLPHPPPPSPAAWRARPSVGTRVPLLEPEVRLARRPVCG